MINVQTSSWAWPAALYAAVGRSLIIDLSYWL